MTEFLRCSNCGYEVDEVNKVGFCQTCQRAYDIGYQQAEREISV